MLQARVYSLVYCLWARPGAYPRIKYLKGVSLGRLLPCPLTLYIQERVARDRHSGLLRKLVNYGRKRLYKIGLWDLYYKDITDS